MTTLTGLLDEPDVDDVLGERDDGPLDEPTARLGRHQLLTAAIAVGSAAAAEVLRGLIDRALR